MELDELMQVFDATASNLGKLDQVWKRAYPLLPTGPSYGSSREYEDLQRIWNDLLPGLPDIDGFGVKVQLPNMDEIGRRYFDEFLISETDFNLPEDIERPGRQLAEYRHRLNRARKNAARNRIQALKKIVETNLTQIIFGVHRNSPDSITTRDSEEVESAIWEIERLMGDATERKGSWGNLHRHLSFGQGHDWHDIHESD